MHVSGRSHHHDDVCGQVDIQTLQCVARETDKARCLSGAVLTRSHISGMSFSYCQAFGCFATDVLISDTIPWRCYDSCSIKEVLFALRSVLAAYVFCACLAYLHFHLVLETVSYNQRKAALAMSCCRQAAASHQIQKVGRPQDSFLSVKQVFKQFILSYTSLHT